jgi:hypothetical protein
MQTAPIRAPRLTWALPICDLHCNRDPLCCTSLVKSNRVIHSQRRTQPVEAPFSQLLILTMVSQLKSGWVAPDKSPLICWITRSGHSDAIFHPTEYGGPVQ